MIQNKNDYRRYIKTEIKGVGNFFVYNYFAVTFLRPISRFKLLLRTCEYLKNCQPYGKLTSVPYWFIKYLKVIYGVKLGYSIPENVVGEGLQLPHYGTIVIHSNAQLGKNCRIHVCVNIGASGGSNEAPKIGDYVYIAPGAKIYGDIIIADRIAIAANAAVNKSFLNSDKLIGGVPAREIGDVDILNHIKS